jgi:low temperature requirement protein LtrA
VSDLAEADSAGSAAAADSVSPRLLRDRSGSQRVTNIELFFDLVYVFAITQLSHYLLGHATVPGALQAGLLLVMIWLVWVYTTWVTNWLAWMILGGPALFLAGHAAFKLVVWRFASWPRLAGIAVLALAADAIPALALAACAAALVTAAVAATDRLPWLPRPAEQPAPPQKRRDT